MTSVMLVSVTLSANVGLTDPQRSGSWIPPPGADAHVGGPGGVLVLVITEVEDKVRVGQWQAVKSPQSPLRSRSRRRSGSKACWVPP